MSDGEDGEAGTNRAGRAREAVVQTVPNDEGGSNTMATALRHALESLEPPRLLTRVGSNCREVGHVAIRAWFVRATEDGDDGPTVFELRPHISYEIISDLPPAGDTLMLVLEPGVRIVATQFFRIVSPSDGGRARAVRCEPGDLAPDVVRCLLRTDPDVTKATRVRVMRLNPTTRFEFVCDYADGAVTAKIVVPSTVRLGDSKQFAIKRAG